MANKKITDYPNSIFPFEFDVSRQNELGEYKTFRFDLSDMQNSADQGNLKLLHSFFGNGGAITNEDPQDDEIITVGSDYFFDFASQGEFLIKANCRLSLDDEDFARMRVLKDGIPLYGDFIGGFRYPGGTGFITCIVPFFYDLAISPITFDIGFAKSAGATASADDISFQIFFKTI